MITFNFFASNKFFTTFMFVFSSFSDSRTYMMLSVKYITFGAFCCNYLPAVRYIKSEIAKLNRYQFVTVCIDVCRAITTHTNKLPKIPAT